MKQQSPMAPSRMKQDDKSRDRERSSSPPRSPSPQSKRAEHKKSSRDRERSSSPRRSPSPHSKRDQHKKPKARERSLPRQRSPSLSRLRYDKKASIQRSESTGSGHLPVLAGEAQVWNQIDHNQSRLKTRSERSSTTSCHCQSLAVCHRVVMKWSAIATTH